MNIAALMRSPEVRVAGVVGLAHGASHFFQLVMPPLFPLLRAEFDVSWTALGVWMSVFYAVSCGTQFFAGVVADRIGARPVLLTGLLLLVGGSIGCALAPNFAVLCVLAVLMGLGNGTVHPCDFAVMNSNIRERRLGYAYAIHGASGNLGSALAPVTSYALAAAFGWRSALLIMGGLGMAVLLIVLSQRRLLLSDKEKDDGQERAEGAEKMPASAPMRNWWQWVTVMCFLYFLLQSVMNSGVRAFTPAVLHEGFDLSLALASSAVTAYLLGSAAGVLTGGFIAARAVSHARVAITGLGAAALVAFSVPWITAWAVLLLPWFAVLGFCVGSTNPSRDMIVRNVTPKGAAGRVYGFVYSGLDLGSTLGPPLFGLLLDCGESRRVFPLIGVVLLLTIFTVTRVRRSATV